MYWKLELLVGGTSTNTGGKKKGGGGGGRNCIGAFFLVHVVFGMLVPLVAEACRKRERREDQRKAC